MKNSLFAASASALLLIAGPIVEAKHGHHVLHAPLKRYEAGHAHPVRHRSAPEAGYSGLALRSPEGKTKGGQCQFPNDAGLVEVTPNEQNAGWAMSPDQPCTPGSYCPYACPPGQVSMQWDPSATEYSYPKSMNGGLYCDEGGKISKPMPDKPYCQDAENGISATNQAGDKVAFCQTVLPGNEAMLIPTDVEDSAELAVPGTDYWAGTAAHYYINPPGVGSKDACVWGTKEKPVGNWSPYVAGANTNENGETFIKLGWNPIYLEPETPFKDEMPSWGVEIECDGDGCNGLPCAIDPAKHSVNEVTGSANTGAGGASFCVVTVPKGVKANYVVFEGSGSSGGKNPKSTTQSDVDDNGSENGSAASPSNEETAPVTGSSAPTEDIPDQQNAVEPADSSSTVEPYAQQGNPRDSYSESGPGQFYEVESESESDSASASDETSPSSATDSAITEFDGAGSTLQMSSIGVVVSSVLVLLSLTI